MRYLKQSGSGFTLIELMITVAIVAILARIAIPAYQSSVQKSRRSDAKSTLLQLAQVMERNNTLSNTYLKDGGGNAVGPTGTTGLPSALIKSPQSGTVYYNLSFQGNVTATYYMLQAIPVAGGPQATDACGTLTIDNTGLKGASGSLGAAGCW